ncbi:MAG: PhzF family phenazine biosynthesis protein [Firmicutes bacterium]|nr:PhzF family phenazine biosynthesis protein [Bacillota bacterium]
MKQMYIADAFTTEKFGGNPAGVVLLKENEDFPSDELMRKTAAELRYSETAFIRPMSAPELEEVLSEMTFGEAGPAASDIDGGFQIRYFTPADEVDLCGHATIASYRCLTDAGLCETGGTYLNRALAGDLFIDVAGDQVLMDMARPRHIRDMRAPEELQELYEVMGIDYCDLGMIPQMISTGLPDIIMPVASREVLDAIDPDFPALTELSRKYEVVGVHAFALAPEGDKVTAYCRNFAPLYDIDEEAATGTSSGALTYYLVRNGLFKGDRCIFIQGEKMGRPSQIRSSIRRDSNGLQIRIGGSAAILVKGRIDL